MNDLQVFKYDFSPEYFGQPADMDIRVVEVEGNPWFVAKDVALVLGYVNTADAIRKFCKRAESLKELQGVSGSRTLSLQPATKLIPESDLYRLVMRSNMEEAERFQDWVCSEVLPTIRKTGGTYMTDDHAEQVLLDPDFIIKMANQIKTIRAERDEAIRTKALVSKGREGTLLSKCGTLTKKVKQLEEKYESSEFLTTRSIDWLGQFFKTHKTKHVHLLIGQDLKQISDRYSLPYHKIPGGAYPITQWHRDAIAIWKAQIERANLRPKLAVYLK